MMKQLSLLILIFLFPLLKATESTIEQVTVFQNGAKITRTATLNLPVGSSEIVFSGITDNFNQSSAQASIKGNAIIVSVKSQINHLISPEKSKRINTLSDSIKWIQQEISWLNEEKKAFQKQLEVLEANKNIIVSEGKLSAIEFSDFVDYYGDKQSSVRKSMHELSIYISEQRELQNKMQQQLNELNGYQKNQTGEILITVLTKTTTKANITFSYITNNAGWRPVYDLRGTEGSKSIEMIYKANVYQNTGQDWNDVALEISTGNPMLSNERPILNPWYIDFTQTNHNNYTTSAASTSTSLLRAPNMAYDKRMVMGEMAFDKVAAPKYVVTESSNQLNATYKIAHKNTISANGKEHLVVLTENNIEAQFKYHAVPKLNETVFLIAKLGAYGKYNLLPGKANIFLNEAYISQTSINPETASDSILISFGRANNISIERTLLEDIEGDKFIGNNKLITKGFEIKTINNNTSSVKLEILDQLPISKQEDIKVEPLENSNAEFNAKTGRLFWDITLPAGKTTDVKFIYSVKFPKDKKVMNF